MENRNEMGTLFTIVIILLPSICALFFILAELYLGSLKKIKRQPNNRHFSTTINQATTVLNDFGLETENLPSHKTALLKLRGDETLSENIKQYSYYLLYLSYLKFFQKPLIETEMDLVTAKEFTFFASFIQKPLVLRYKQFFWTAKYTFETPVYSKLLDFIKVKAAKEGIVFCRKALSYNKDKGLYYDYSYGIEKLWDVLFTDKVCKLAPRYSDTRIEQDKSLAEYLISNKDFIELFLSEAHPYYQTRHIRKFSDMYKYCTPEQLQLYLKIVIRRVDSLQNGPSDRDSLLGGLSTSLEIMNWEAIVLNINLGSIKQLSEW